ncbi:MAG: hypothetical protein RQ936_07855, partial [Gammaproteobacteria bacterium]|nr:hypothetical protein [Gammaproteobacteria bacterium]
MEVSAEEEIKQVEVGKPHVVILGAGASYAAFPNGDARGNKLPLMNNFVETLGIEKLGRFNSEVHNILSCDSSHLFRHYFSG